MQSKNSNKFLYILLLLSVNFSLLAQESPELIFPNPSGWNVRENDTVSFTVTTAGSELAYFTMEGPEELKMKFDTLGNFFWVPSYDLVDRIAKTKEVTVILQADWKNGARSRKSVTFTVNHVNRAPVVEDLPIAYVRQSSLNNYQISSDYVYDPDGDPIVIKAIPTKMPEGAILSSLGQFTWTPSRSQFYSLRTNPLFVDFVVQDQPDKLETIGKLKVQQTQQDLPPEILILPGDSAFVLKEDETINLKIYVSDPNGDDNIMSTSFIANDNRIPSTLLKENTAQQYEFTWTPGYDFVEEVNQSDDVKITFFALDKSNNRAQRTVVISIKDTENLIELDANQYRKYRNNLVAATMLINSFDANQKKLNNDYKKAKKGKKNRSILNASLGAATGLSPITLETENAKIVSGIGGTTVLTMGTLEATEVIGKSKDDIMDKIKTGIDLKNKIQSAGDEFARKYALKSSRRSNEFEKDIDKFRAVMNDQRLVLLEIDAYSKNQTIIKDKDIKKVFLDFSEE